MNSNKICVGYEPFEGYRLSKRLGAGGYGEVWQCDAPGGLQKAIKFIYGNAAGPQAAKELRSLQRISKVYHPFLLSLERIEAIGDQVVVVTELAECSLEDRLRAYRSEGISGIPRSNLLEFFRDAADALDFLASEHNLAHLDVKPANLLIISKRIKVGDFGLLKDLHDVRQSSVGGMTPAYSAPEVFDGRPDFRSDQYALAISYVELLTGSLPFSGNSLAELAKQHISATPNLDALPPADRPIVARALNKDPFDRFPNCRQFIDQLLRVRHSMLPTGNEGKRGDIASASPQSKHSTQSVKLDGSRPVALPRHSEQPLKPSVTPTHSLFIGLGGLGSLALADMRHQLAQTQSAEASDWNRWLAIDTDPEALRGLYGEGPSQPGKLREDETLLLKIESPAAYRNAAPGRFRALSRRWLYNIPRSRRTEGIRPLALLPMIQHRDYLRTRISEAIHSLLDVQSPTTAVPRTNIYVLSSLHGGTGSALLAEMGVLTREVLAEICVGQNASAAVSIRGFATAAESMYAGAVKMAPAAALAALSEISCHMSPDASVPSLAGPQAGYGVKRDRPFDWLALVDGGMLGDAGDAQDAANKLSSAVLADAATDSGNCLDEIRAQRPESDWLRTLHVAPLTIVEPFPQEHFAQFCSVQALTKAHNADEAELQDTANSPPTEADDLKASNVQYAILRATGLQDQQETGSEYDSILAETTISKPGLWSQRLSSNEDEVKLAVEADGEAILLCIRNLAEAHGLAFRQSQSLLQRLQLQFTHWSEAGNLELDDSILASGMPIGSLNHKRQHLSRYCAALANQLDGLLQVRRTNQGKLLESYLTSRRTIASGVTEQTARNLAHLISESPRLRALTQATSRSIAQWLHSKIALPTAYAFEAIADPLLDVASLSQLAIEVANELALENGVHLKPADPNAADTDQQLTAQLHDGVAPLAKYGGNYSRLVVAANDQISTLLQHACQGGDAAAVASSTTLCRAHNPSSAPIVVTEATQLPLGLLVRNLWHPNLDTFKLAEKLRTRVDVDWPSVDSLLDSPETATIQAIVTPTAELSSAQMPLANPTTDAQTHVNETLQMAAPQSNLPQ